MLQTQHRESSLHVALRLCHLAAVKMLLECPALDIMKCDAFQGSKVKAMRMRSRENVLVANTDVITYGQGRKSYNPIRMLEINTLSGVCLLLLLFYVCGCVCVLAVRDKALTRRITNHNLCGSIKSHGKSVIFRNLRI